jgi:hypothetical protein
MKQGEAISLRMRLREVSADLGISGRSVSLATLVIPITTTEAEHFA